ncbi:hypothetical protein NA57DRAFT_8357, partial [Rhizodiscina lignyota]
AHHDTPLSKAQAKARMWLTGLSEKILYYGNIFDVLVQQHPEYVSLAWGTFKLLFVAIANHAESASKLSKSVSQVADLLPQQSLLLVLYPTAQMQTSVARLYAHILIFFVSALKWYKDSRLVHAIKSILQPWDMKFRTQYEAIAAETQQVRRLAEVALNVEVRDTRLEVLQGMLKEIRLDLTSQRTTLNRVHLNQMLSLPMWNSLPTSGESLQFCRSMRNRHRAPMRLQLPEVEKLNAWSLQKSSPLLLIDTYIPAVAKAFMVDLIDLVQTNRMQIIWALRYEEYWSQRLRATDIVRMLTLQAMQVGAGNLLDSPFPITVEQLREAAGLQQWVAILGRMLTSISSAFIVLDADLLAHATAYDRS